MYLQKVICNKKKFRILKVTDEKSKIRVVSGTDPQIRIPNSAFRPI
jgi:hypothetical protein